jgi:hypothetical protein
MAYHTQGSPRSPRGEPSPTRGDIIPLVCFICPKNSQFSDLSHLLTHISSKGHLHNMFQLNLSRDVDENAALALAEFDSWFKKNSISALLRARKTAREQRGNQQRRNQAPMRGGSSVAQSRSTRGGRSSRRGRANNVSILILSYLISFFAFELIPRCSIILVESVSTTTSTMGKLSSLSLTKTMITSFHAVMDITLHQQHHIPGIRIHCTLVT